VLSHGRDGFPAWSDGHDFELTEIAPFRDPTLKKSDIVAAHYLKATSERLDGYEQHCVPSDLTVFLSYYCPSGAGLQRSGTHQQKKRGLSRAF
jgi:hypothetical protein